MFAVNVYNFRFAMLCVVLATASAYCVLTLAGSEAETPKWRAIKSAVLTLALGLGVWAAAGIGLASLPQAGSASYLITDLLSSLAVSVAGSWTVIYAAADPNGRIRTLVETSILLAATIIATHLTAMYSLRSSAGWAYHLPSLYGAVLLALAGSCLTVLAAFREPGRTLELRKSKEPAALLLGLTIAGAFYCILGGVTMGSSYVVAEPGAALSAPILTAAAVGAALVSIFGSAAVTAAADRKVFLRALTMKIEEKTSKSVEQIMPASQTGMYQVSLDGRILDVDEACARLWGYESRDGARGGDVRAHFGEPDEFTKLILNLELNGGSGTQELQFSKRDGSVLWVLHNASIIRREGDAAQVIQATFLDITAQRFQRVLPVLPKSERTEQPAWASGPNQPAANLLSLGTAVAFSSKRVLVADKNAASRQALASLLECWQVHPILVDSREAAARHMRQSEKIGQKIDLLLLDSEIAGRAFSFVAQLRRDFKFVPPVLMVLDGSDRAPGPEALKTAGIAACLFKPIWRTDLGQAMLEALFGNGPYPQTKESETTGTHTEKDSRLRL